MSIKRTIIATVLALALVAVVAPGVTQAVTIDELMAQIGQLQAQLTALQGAGATPVPTGNLACAGITFTRNLVVGSTGSDVKCLQVLMNNNGYTLAQTGAGSPGMETSYFGPRTLAVVRAFQAAKGWTPANQVGPLTRAALNALINSTPGIPPVVPPVTPAAGGLSIGLAYDTPASTSVADNTNANFTKFSLTAGSGPVNVTRIYVTRAGLSTNSIVENIKIVEADTGTYRGTTASLNADNRALITFTPALVIPANTTKTYFIRAGIVDNTASGQTVTLGIVSNTDITSNATAVTGAPAVGNPMSTILLTVGTLSIVEDGGLSDSTPDVGDTNVAVNQFKLSAGSTEAVTVETITALKAGTADLTDTNNIELYDITHNKSLGTVASWDSEEKATWSNLGLVIAKGESLRLKILVDVVGGVESTALTVDADVVDGTDTLVIARGNSYGFYITPTRTGSWDGLGTAQTINSGALTITKSSTSPATGSVAVGDDVVLGVFDFDAKGEDIRITSLPIEATLSGMLYTDVTNVRIFDESGSIVAGPMDLDSTPDATFTDTIIVPVGIHKYTVKAKLDDAVATGETILIDVATPTASVVAKGMTSGDTIAPTPATDVSANTLTVAAGDMDLITLTTPVASNVAKGTSDFIWATASLSATNSGEAVQVTSITVNDDTDSNSGTNGDPDDIDNAELWADLTSANSARGDVYETKISDTKQLTGGANDATNAQAFSLTQTITVPKGGFVKVALVADINASASTTADVHTFTFTDGTFTGATSGETISDTPTGSGQAMTVTTGGVLTISKDSSSPVSDIVVSGETSTLGVFRLAASNVENLDVDDITFVVTGGDMVNTYSLYNGTALLGTASGGTGPKFVLADGTVTVPKNNYVRLTLKAALVDKDSTTNNTTITAGLEGTHAADAVNTTGLSSGNEVDSDLNNATANGMDIYKTKPTFAAVTTRSGYQLSGNLIPSSSMLAAIFDVTANASEDVTFEQSGSSSTSGYLIVHVGRVQNDTDGSANTWTLKDQDGTTLDTASVADAATTAVFDFADSAFTVPAGTTRSLMIYADTSEFEDDGDTIQLHLDDDNSGDNIYWSINNVGDYADGDKIFRGDIYAGSFVNPS